MKPDHPGTAQVQGDAGSKALPIEPVFDVADEGAADAVCRQQKRLAAILDPLGQDERIGGP